MNEQRIENLKDLVTLIVSIGAGFYALGFVIVRTYLSEYGISESNLVAARYISVGFLFVSVFILTALPAYYSYNIIPSFTQRLLSYIFIRPVRLLFYNPLTILLDSLCRTINIPRNSVINTFILNYLFSISPKYPLFLLTTKVNNFSKIWESCCTILIIDILASSKSPKIGSSSIFPGIIKGSVFFNKLSSELNKLDNSSIYQRKLSRIVIFKIFSFMPIYFFSSFYVLFLLIIPALAFIFSVLICNLSIVFLSSKNNLITLFNTGLSSGNYQENKVILEIFFTLIKELLLKWYLPIYIIALFYILLRYSIIKGNWIFSIPNQFWIFSSLVLVFILIVKSYSLNIYPVINQAFGGGQAIMVQLIVDVDKEDNHKKTFAQIAPLEINSSKSIELCLLDESDKSYFLLVRKTTNFNHCIASQLNLNTLAKFRAIKVEKDIIKGVLYLPD